ncbi:hypothetical protein C943_01448 [Mariniradius saccharolyticus AK6]|uniref:Uncharacterized protein n=1 Tax=Mariniradius saccharolyticus AK6 TaxID=1239962 RepID=M7Y4K2_9BACT|nr:hypothetical protein C943_01448 [Mariniradius saccharolyticus AK6]
MKKQDLKSCFFFFGVYFTKEDKAWVLFSMSTFSKDIFPKNELTGLNKSQTIKTIN